MKFIISTKLLMYKVSSIALNIKQKVQTILGFESTSIELLYIETSEIPMFEIKSYYDELPILKDLLDFIQLIGGKY